MKKLGAIPAFFGFLLLVTGACGCKKYLDKKPASKLAVPQTARDLQALLDNYNVLNTNSPAALEISADNYYLNSDDFDRLTDDLKRMHTWQPDHLFEPPPNDWNYLYRTVMVANTVLEHANNLENSDARDNIMGQAYCWRGFSFLKAVLIWSVAYDSVTAAKDLGIPLRLDVNFNEPSVRASVARSYQQVITDMMQAISLLPATNLHCMRPSLPAALGLLAKTYMAMRRYDSVYKYSSLALQLRSDPQDFNDSRILPTANFPFSSLKYNNADIIFESAGPPTTALAVTRGRIDSTLYNAYQSNDLRKTIFFRRIINNEYGFKGSYEGGNSLFAGMTVGELYLMHAESACRLGKLQESVNDLNTLLVRRWRSGTFQPLAVSSQPVLLNTILLERRKELLMRGHRWMDIKRLNKEGANIYLLRNIGSQQYRLLPNDKRFALPIPEDVIELSGMPQNPR